MKKFTFCFIIPILLSLFFAKSFSQNANIVYAGSGLSNINNCPLCCNVFNQSGNNPTVGGFVHAPVSGGATFDGTNINMQTRKDPFQNIDNGTAYAIAYNFKVGYNYVIAIDLGHSSNPNSQFPKITTSLRTSLPSPGQTQPTVCGPVNGSYYLSSIGSIVGVIFPTQATVKTYPIASFSVSTAQNYLIITVSDGATGGSNVNITKVVITETLATCNLPAPTGLTAYNIMNDFASIQWNAVTNAVSYSFDYRAASSSTWIHVNTKPTATGLNLAFLNNGTTYDIRVKANCSASIGGAYAISQFNTECYLANVTNLLGSNVINNSSTITWTYPATPLGPTVPVSYNLEYKDVNATLWNIIVVPNIPNPDPANNPTNISYQLTALNNTSVYDLRVKANCQVGGGNYVATQFPSITCNAPYISWTSPINTEASLGWSKMPLAASYEVQVDYDPLVNHNWVTVATGIVNPFIGDPNYNVTGLVPLTTYGWRVRTLCSNGFYSSYTTPTNFTTLANCGVSVVGLTNSNITSTNATINWSLSSPSGLPRIEFKLISASTWTCYNFCFGQSSPATVGPLTPNSTYLIRVTPFCPASSGSFGAGISSQIQVTTPPSFTVNAIEQDAKTIIIYNSQNSKIEDAKLHNTEYSVFPSPAKDKITVYFKSPITCKTNIQLVNAFGNIVFSNQVKGTNQSIIDVEKYSNGLYFLKITNEQMGKTQKIMIQH